jgi:hypothetical protein
VTFPSHAILPESGPAWARELSHAYCINKTLTRATPIEIIALLSRKKTSRPERPNKLKAAFSQVILKSNAIGQTELQNPSNSNG